MNRKKILKDVVQLNNFREARQKLLKLKWDHDIIYLITDKALINSLNKIKVEEISEQDIEDWANTIEGRDDLEFESDRGKEAIEKLANPVLYGSISNILDEVYDELSDAQ